MCLVQIRIGHQTVLFGTPPIMKFVTDMLLSLHSCSPCWQVDVFCELCEFLGTRSQRGCYTTGKSKALRT